MASGLHFALRRAPAAAGVLGVVLIGAGALILRPIAPPTFAEVRGAYRPSEAYLLDRQGEVLDTQRVEFGVRRLAWTPLAEVSPALVTAVVEAEDRRYWHHAGVDWQGVAGAVRSAVIDNRRRGASTITMQLASLLDESRGAHKGSRDFAQKIRQVRLALGLEFGWSKAQILEAYLNVLPFRGELRGVRAASEVLARKSPSGLTVAESRVLAALLPSPTASPDRVAARGCARLSGSEASRACAEIEEAAGRLLVHTADTAAPERLAPHLASALLRQPGQSVRTTLDVDIQRLARDALKHHLAGLAARNVRDGAALVIDNASGDVLAYVGSGGPGSRAAQVDGVRARRQAGSTLKPFLYELALERRFVTAASLLDDSPVNIDTPSGIYLPQDYDHDYKGAVSVRTALGGSLNVPAVRTLMLVGVEPFRDRLNALGYAGITEVGAYYGDALALGSAEVSLWEQAQAYRVLALGGRLSALRIRAQDPVAPLRSVLPADASFVIGDVLSDPAARAVTFGLQNSLSTGYWSAVKTGTSKDMRDNWCIGYTSRYTVAVWVGNFEGDPMHDVSGVTGAAPVWREIMDGLQSARTDKGPGAPSGLRALPARFASGVEPPRQEWFLEGTSPGDVIQSVGREAYRSRITSPANGMVIAIDPDIPSEQQRIPIAVQGGSPGLIVKINDAVVGHTGGPLMWQPEPGAHRISIEDQTGHVVDRALFSVR